MTPHECILACFALASYGHLDEARENLRRNRPCLETEEGLDLLARIELHLGNEAEARRLWTQAVETGIGGRFSRRALDALDSVPWRHRRLIRNLRRGFAIGIPALFGLLIGIFSEQLCAVRMVERIASDYSTKQCQQVCFNFETNNESITMSLDSHSQLSTQQLERANGQNPQQSAPTFRQSIHPLH